MRRFALAVLVVLASPLLMGAGQPAPQRHLDLSAADRAELDAVSAYLNGVTTLKGGFLQAEPNGTVDEGTFYISKPGKMRFEYHPPSPTLVVADGHTVAVANKRLNTVTKYPLGETPLGVVLNNTVDLRHDPRLFGVAHQGGILTIYMRTTQNRAKANIAMRFTEPEFELREWSVIDDQGLTTTVSLTGVQPGVSIPAALFVLPDVNPFGRHKD